MLIGTVHADTVNQTDTAQKFDIDIPELNAAEALNVLAEQTNAVLLFPYKDASVRQANSVRGYYTLMNALNILLQGSGLTGGLSKGGAIKISVVEGMHPNQEIEESKSMKKNKLSVGILAAIGAFFGGGHIAHAQDTTPSTALTEEIVVTGVRGSILNAMNQKRDSAGFVDGISAEDLGKFPDLNLSESLQRIPGITLTRNDFGDGSSINLRGLGPTFSRIEINGLTGSGGSGAGPRTNDSRGGGFNFEVLASELFSNASVKKSFNAGDAEGGLAGLAGLVQLNTPRAFDRDGFSMSASAQGQYGERAGDVGPRTALLISQNWDDVFGVTASIAYSDTEYTTSSNGGISARPFTSAALNDGVRATLTPEQAAGLIPSTINYEVNNDSRKTIGSTLGFQFRPSEQIEVTVDSIYANIEGDRRFTRADAPPESRLIGIANETITDGVIRSATITDVQNRIATNDRDSEEDFFQLSADVKYQPNDHWTITPFLGYTNRKVEDDSALLSFARGDLTTGGLSRFPVTYDVNGNFIEFSSPGLNLEDPNLANEYLLNVFILRPTVDEDQEISSKLDFRYDFDDSPISHIEFGARYSKRELDRSFIEVRVDEPSFGASDLTTVPTLADALVFEDFDIDGAPSSFPSRIISGDPDALLDLYFLNGFNIDDFRSPITGPVQDVRIAGLTPAGTLLINRQDRAAQNTFSGEEETTAFYGEITFEVEQLLFNAGVRYIDTDQTSSGFQVANRFSTAISTSNSYSELLPSMSLRYEATPDVVVRAAYAKSLTRPTLFDLRVAENFGGIDESGGSGSRGNPELDPFTADNMDLGVEWYFAPEGLVALNAFYKNINGLVVTTSEVEDREYLAQTTGARVTGPITFSLPTNGESTEIKGLEFILQSRFDFLPGAFSNFGGVFNYTYADADASFVEGQSTDAGVASIEGVSKTSYNAIVYYDDGRLDARMSYAYRGRFVESLAGSFGVPVFQNGRGQMDFSLNYGVTDKLTLQFQALNLTDERLETESVRGLPHDTGQLDRRFFFGMRYAF